MSLAAAIGLTLVLAACGSSVPGQTFSSYITIVLNTAPTQLPYVAKFTEQGAQLAVDQINHGGGVKVGNTTYGIKLEKLDNQLSPSSSLSNIQKAISDKASAVIDDGYTVSATYQDANAAGLPIMIDYDSNATLIDPAQKPNVYRIAPPNDALAGKLVGYLKPRGLKLALITDDSDYGTDGHTQLLNQLHQAGLSVAPDIQLPANATGYDTQALQVKSAGATGVIIWARSSVVAQFVGALRQAGSTAAIFSGPNAEDPIVRTQNAAHPEYVAGLTYATFRITTEGGTTAWDSFRHAYETHNFNDGGPDFHVGVQASDHKDVVQPPDWQIFPYDMVRLVAAAVQKAGTVDPAGGKLIDALNQVKITSANGDNRGWSKDNHEGVVDDDIYFATFMDMKFKPVQDDPLSKSLPPIDQE